jgi:hypothetical protein
MDQSKDLFSPIIEDDTLQLTQDYEKFVNVERVMLWDGGFVKSPERKSIDERIEQVTGFPALHYSEFIIDKLEPGKSYWQPHYDTIDGSIVPIVTITIFLTDVPDEDNGGGEIVYPSTTSNTDPIKIRPIRGLAVVHHNTDSQNQFEVNSLHALLPISKNSKLKEYYIARKFILPGPVSKARRMILPILAAPYGGKLPHMFVSLYRYMIFQFGQENGDEYYDAIFFIVPGIIALLLAQLIGIIVLRHVRSEFSTSDTSATEIPKKKKTIIITTTKKTD